MVPAGIGPAGFCLVSPCAKLEPGQRIWLRDRKGREGLRWLIRLTAATYEVAAWQPPKLNGHPRTWSPSGGGRTDVDDRGVILAVYRGWVVPSDPVHRLPELAPWPAHRFVASAVRRGTGNPGCGSGASRRDDLLFQPEDQGLARAEYGPAAPNGGSPPAGRQGEAVGAVAVPAIGSVPQPVWSARRTDDRFTARPEGEPRAVTDPARAQESAAAAPRRPTVSSPINYPSAHFPPPARL